jgi:ABC-type uncharacterized transport system ATPase subunit
MSENMKVKCCAGSIMKVKMVNRFSKDSGTKTQLEQPIFPAIRVNTNSSGFAASNLGLNSASPATDDIVVVEDLRKTYGKDILAVDGISFRVHKGEIFGFLGPNGAGKSTTIKILTTLLEKSSGKATIDGLDVDADQAQVRRIIGYSSQDVGVDDDLTARENLLLQCEFHHIPKDKAKKKVEELLETVRLIEAADRRLKTFSARKQDISLLSLSLRRQTLELQGLKNY